MNNLQLFILEKILKSYINKYNKLNSSDKNELIHTAIKQIKKSDKAYLTTKQINKLINYFNLDPIKGIKKIWQLESLHFENISLWKKLDNKDGFEEEVVLLIKKIKVCMTISIKVIMKIQLL